MDGRIAPHKDPGGFLEGALLNKDLTAAHDKFMADVEVGGVWKNDKHERSAVMLFPDCVFCRRRLRGTLVRS